MCLARGQRCIEVVTDVPRQRAALHRGRDHVRPQRAALRHDTWERGRDARTLEIGRFVA